MGVMTMLHDQAIAATTDQFLCQCLFAGGAPSVRPLTKPATSEEELTQKATTVYGLTTAASCKYVIKIHEQ